MRTVLGIITDIRATGADVFADPKQDNLILVGPVPAHLTIELDQRTADAVALFREHQPVVTLISDRQAKRILARRPHKK